RYTLSNANGVKIRLINFGATVTDIIIPDKSGKPVDISLGFDSASVYEERHCYIGASLGRVTERIAGAKFNIDGTEYKVTANDGNEKIHQVHGGKYGFDMKMFAAAIEGDKVVMKYVSPDGEEGFPGEVTTTITFQFNDNNEFILEYTATTTKATPVNLSNHVYFNLAGHGAGKIGDHLITVPTGIHLPIEKSFVPKAEYDHCFFLIIFEGVEAKVDGTPFDLRKPTKLWERIKDVLVSCYVFGDRGKMKHVARLDHEATGRSVDCFTTESCMETYFSCAMKTQPAKGGATYDSYENGGICLIPMQHSSGVNMPNFPDSILRPGQTYHQKTLYKFGF
ncbi:hypothetical protein FSP39_015867, partial [Pinctada imbricata]